MKHILLFLLASSAYARVGYTYRPKLDKPLRNVDLNPILILDNDAPPVILIDPSKLISLTFDKEVKRCASKSAHLKMEKVNVSNPDKATRYFELSADIKALKSSKPYISSIYNFPTTNINCYFTDGKVAVLMAKFSRRYHATVLFRSSPPRSLDNSIFWRHPPKKQNHRYQAKPSDLRIVSKPGVAPIKESDHLIFWEASANERI
ncbi:MAG: hypothetical protein AB8G05_06915 [Oligoflexales bacterium]